jgi:hypothetical protein
MAVINKSHIIVVRVLKRSYLRKCAKLAKRTGRGSAFTTILFHIMFWTLNGDCAGLLFHFVPFQDRRSLRATNKMMKNWIDDNKWVLSGTPVQSLKDIQASADNPLWIRFHVDQSKSASLDFLEFQPGLTPSQSRREHEEYDKEFFTPYDCLYGGMVGKGPIMALVERTVWPQSRVVGWIEGAAFDPSACPIPWNYFYWPDEKRRATERAFARYTVFVDQRKPIVVYKTRSELRDPIRLNTDIYRLFYDSGSDLWDDQSLVFPVWIKDRLGLPESVQQALLAQIDRLDAERRDIHPNGVVHDIVDPDLFPYPMEPESSVVTQAKYLAHIKQILGHTPGELWWLSGDADSTVPVPDLRGGYHWIPSDVVVRSISEEHGTTYRSEFLSPIHGLHRPEDAELARNVQAVFQKMLPLFAKLHFFKQSPTTKLQVTAINQQVSLRRLW